MNAQLKALVLSTKANTLSNKPLVGAAVGAVAAVALPTLLSLRVKPVVEEAVKATKSAVTK